MTLRGITKRFPEIVANDHIDFEARSGEIHALLGENGAGKSTLSNIITGLYRPDEGEIAVLGRPVQFHAPRDALEAGIFMVHQHFRLVASFTVAENIMLGHHQTVAQPLLLDPRAIERDVLALSERYHMPVNPRARIWQLSVGEQQRVEILKALHRGARILILDEPTALLTPQETEGLFATLRVMAGEGRTVIFITHKLEEVMAVSERVTILRRGRSLGTLQTGATSPRELARLMVGRDVVFTVQAEEHAVAGPPVLELQHVYADSDLGTPALHDVDLRLRAGEIVGVAGVAGNGQRELAETITGARRRTTGTVMLAGRPLRSGDPRQAIRLGLAHVPEDRMGTGVAPGLTIAENLILKSYQRPPMSWLGLVRWGLARTRASELISRFAIAGSPQTPTRLLSGGNVQKVLLARELSSSPRVLVAASPTRGLDVAATEAVREMIRQAAAAGVAVLLISEDLEEILALADRIAVLYEGRIMGVVERRQANIDDIGLMMAGAATQGAEPAP
ncbi:MAG TPA: ABC transporter ATP-binding protein [Candidatus Limnocylindrales bacterium]|nr:ABC transporter ATP-binding protein [Candidatus Limnocylindrales bacterium]